VAVGTGKKDVQRAVVNELTKNLSRTQIVNARDLRDPEALERLGGPASINGRAYRAHVVLA
jgi:hypothetical protein